MRWPGQGMCSWETRKPEESLPPSSPADGQLLPPAQGQVWLRRESLRTLETLTLMRSPSPHKESPLHLSCPHSPGVLSDRQEDLEDTVQRKLPERKEFHKHLSAFLTQGQAHHLSKSLTPSPAKHRQQNHLHIRML